MTDIAIARSYAVPGRKRYHLQYLIFALFYLLYLSKYAIKHAHQMPNFVAKMYNKHQL